MSSAERDDWRPVATPGRDTGALQLTPVEGYLLSRIDGATSVAELALISGMASQALWPILQRLAREGAIDSPPVPQAAPRRRRPRRRRPHLRSTFPRRPKTRRLLPRTHRQLFETKLHPMPEDARAALASTAGEPELSALCFDPVPSVVRAVMENSRAGLPHARLIAAHHGNAVGLDALGEKPALLQDTEVQRLLLRNQQTCDAPAAAHPVPAPADGRLQRHPEPRAARAQPY